MNNLSLLIIALPFMMTACGHQEAVNANKVQPTITSLVKDSSNNKNETVATHKQSPGKPSAPISLEYSFEGKPTLGQPLNVRVKLKGLQQAEPVKAALKY